MPCLNLTNGPLLPPDIIWQRGTTVTTPNGTTITSTTAGPNPGVSIVKGASSQFFPEATPNAVRFANWGTPANFVAVLTITGDTRSVVVVDISGTTVTGQLVLTTSAPAAVSLPHINPSATNGAAALLWGSNGSGGGATVSALIIRSFDGDVLCSAVPFTPTGEVNGDITATSLLIKNGGATVSSCPRPTGLSDVTPDPQNFPEAVLGPGVPPSMSSSQRQFTVRNGPGATDCLTVSAIGNVAPYSVVGTSRPLPATLDPGQTMTVDVRFAPTAPGTFNRDLPLTLTPSAGDLLLRCRGQARNAITAISFSGSIGFGTSPLGTAVTRTLTITNTGDLDVTINIPAAPAGSEFQWSALSTVITPGASATRSITFAPTTEGLRSVTLVFTSTAPSSPHNVTLSGTGCVARALINIVSPTAPGFDFGQIERGFRSVRIVRVINSGNGQLSFRASASGPLFGIQQAGGPVTSAPSTGNFTVDPLTPCGAGGSGTGEVVFGVTFFADGAPGIVSGQLIIDNHNAAGGAPASFTFNLQAEIVAVINVDAEVVLDRSGSMGETSGSRNKSATSIDAARLFVQLARAGVDDRIGLVKFNNVPQVFSPITAVTTANQPGMVAAINGTELAPINNTCIAGGVIEALRDMDSTPRPIPPPSLRRAVAVLTDGKDNTSYLNPADGITYSLLGEDGTTALPTPPNTRVYAIGIGDSIDTGRLGQLAQATGGAFLQVLEFTGSDYFKLEKHFTQIYMDTVDLATIQDPVFTILPGAQHVIDFDVLRGDVGCMVVVYDRDGVRLPFYLKTPTGETIDLTSVPPGFQIRPGITNTARFLEVKFPLGEPSRYSVKWQLIVTHDRRACITRGGENQGTGGFNSEQFGFGFQPERCVESDKPIMYGFAIGVGSNFRMMPFVDPGIVSTGQPIQLNAEITECGLEVTGCVVTVASRAPDGVIRSFVLRDDGSNGDGAANDGNYGHRFLQTNLEGTYEFTFRASGQSRDGEPVVREAVRAKYVQGRVPLDDPHGGSGGTGEGVACCKRLSRWLWIVILLLLLILIVLLLIWRS